MARYGPFFFDDVLLALKFIVGTLGLKGVMFVSIPFNPKWQSGPGEFE